MARLMVAWLMLVALTLGPVPPARATGGVPGIEGGFVICHADPGSPAPAPAKAPGHASDCQLCMICHPAMAQALPVDTTGLAIPAPVTARPLAWVPPAIGPPRFVRDATPPTGPPASI